MTAAAPFPPAGAKPKRRMRGAKVLGAAPNARPDQRARGGGTGIHIKPSHKGLLHKDLGVAAGKPISEKKMEAAKADASPAEKKRITFAENAKSWHKGG